MIEIIPDLWIGRYKDINTSSIVLIDCYHDLDFITNSDDRIKYELVELYKYINSKIEFIHAKLNNNNTVIIACKTCTQLSPLVACCYLIRYGNMSIIDSLRAVKSKKHNVFEGRVMFSNILDKIYQDNNK
jgi:protein-tyrosine phosphatase